MVVVRRRVFPEAFKRQAVDRVATSDLSVAAVAAELEIHETILRRWMNQFPVTPNAAAPIAPPVQVPAAVSTTMSDLVAEIAELRIENERLRAEREVLKKALAIVFAELK
jgi:transposase